MNPEERIPNYFRRIVIEQLQFELKLVDEGTLPNKQKYVDKIIQNFLEKYKDNELVNLKTSEEVKEELRKLEAIQKARYDGDER